MIFVLFKQEDPGAEEMAHWLRGSIALTEELSLILSTQRR